MKIGAKHLQPLLGAFELRADLFNERPEARAVVHLDEVSNFVCRDVI
jgi:hypothetical protein